MGNAGGGGVGGLLGDGGAGVVYRSTVRSGCPLGNS
jgi:hypothetical protein